MATRTCRVGLHGRNNETFTELDYQVIRTAKIETLKMMGQTSPAVFKRLKAENPNIELITRLYDNRFGVNKHPSPQEFAKKQIPIMRALQPYCTKFEIHNEPNHQQRFEGWGQEDYHAQDFNAWFLQVYDLLKSACSWAQLGFPGLAVPHRDLEWVEICRPAVERADWLGVHCYWQTPPGQEHNHLADTWGLRFKYYHQLFPQKILEITECGNSNIQADPPIPISENALAEQYAAYYQELFKYPYLNSASFFLLSSQDPSWDFFAWRTESGRIKPVVQKTGQMSRPQLTGARVMYPVGALPGSTFTVGGTLSLPKLPVINLTASLPRNPNTQYPTRAQSDIRQIIIHHTAVSEKIGPERIAQLQVDRQQKPGISYHFFIASDGTVYQTNALTTVTAHTAGNNKNSLAIAFAGNFTNHIPSTAQLQAGAILCATLMLQLNIPPSNIKGAQELVATQSPGKQWLAGQQWKNKLLAQINAVRGAIPETPIPVSPQPAAPASAEKIAELAAQLAQALSANRLAQQRIALLEAELAQLKNAPSAGGQSPTTPASVAEIADLKERIAVLEMQLSIAREMAQKPTSTTPVVSTPNQPRIDPPPIENIVTQLPQNPGQKYSRRSLSEINTIVVHHTGVPAEISAERIADFSVKKNNWPGIGFHYLINADGTIQQTNDLTTVSYHAGEQNQSSVGIAFAGNFNDAVPTPPQIAQGGHLIAWLLGTLQLPLSAVRGHKELASTPCPGEQWDAGSMWQTSLRQAISNQLAGSTPSPLTPVTQPSVQPVSNKPVFHYLLLSKPEDRQNAINYISKFQPTVGFDVERAKDAQYVTIVGNYSGISAAAEARLQASGSKVERIAGNTPVAIRALLDNMARTNRRFLTLQGA